MKIASILVCFLFCTLSIKAQESIAGTWNTGKENTTIEISAVDGVYEGAIVSSDNAKAPVGKLLLKEVKSVGGEWKGKIFAAQKGEWMDATLKEKGDKLHITVKAGWMTKKIKWSKA